MHLKHCFPQHDLVFEKSKVLNHLQANKENIAFGQEIHQTSWSISSFKCHSWVRIPTQTGRKEHCFTSLLVSFGHSISSSLLFLSYLFLITYLPFTFEFFPVSRIPMVRVVTDQEINRST